MRRMQEARDPLFDPEIIHRHITQDWVRSLIESALQGFERGEKKHSHGRLPTPEEMGTDEALTSAIPHPAHSKDLQGKILDILIEVRELGILKKVPHGADREIGEAREWNSFVEEGAAGAPKWGWHYLFNLPLSRAIGHGLWTGGYDALREIRVAADLNPHPGHIPERRVGKEALLPYTPAHIDEVARAGAEAAANYGSGIYELFSTREGPRCPKTDKRLDWAEDRLLDPALGIWHYPPLGERGEHRFELLEAFDQPKPIRHVEISLPSGVLYMADWFRIPGFNEGIGPHDYSRPSITSDLGVDIRTRDHFERLGLMRIHTTNCSPEVLRDGDTFRVCWVDEDHEELWQEDPERPGRHIRSNVALPEVAGRVCCDLWDVTFADQEILKDILLAGAASIEENGGKGDRDQEVNGAPRTREEAQVAIEAYARENSVARLEFEPGTVLHVYMATGGDMELFAERFSSPDTDAKPWIKDMFILSSRPLEVEPSLVEEADWTWPERYARQQDMGMEP